ncbi:MAG: hypothetical protein ACI4KG_08810 [Oscillospiraceae bacterium]
MVFRTFDTDVKGLSNQLGIFGKSFKTISSEVNQSLDGVEGRLNRFRTAASSFFKSAFSKPIITETDSVALNKYAKSLINAKDENAVFAKTMSNASEAAREQSKVILDLNKQYKSGKISEEQYIEQCETVTQSTKNLIFAQKSASVASKALGTALKLALNVGIMVAINLIITGISKIVNQMKELKEEIDGLKSDLDNTRSEIEDINSTPLDINNKERLFTF